MILSCFLYTDWVTFELLNTKRGWDSFFVLQLNMTSWGCLVGSGNKDISSANNLKFLDQEWNLEVLQHWHVETWPLRTMRCLLLVERLSKFLDIPFWINLKIILSFRTLSNTFKMSIKTALTSWPLSKDL